MPEADLEDELLAAARAAGVGVEQVGLSDAVRVVVDEEGLITLYLGEGGDEQFDDADEARERIDEYAEEYGGDGSRPGAIVEFVRMLDKLAAKRPAARRAEALANELEDKMLEVADKLGLEQLRKVYVEDVEIQADEDGDVGFFEDGNEVLWHVFVEDGAVRYEVFDREA
jgi:hypothetical protein